MGGNFERKTLRKVFVFSIQFPVSIVLTFTNQGCKTAKSMQILSHYISRNLPISSQNTCRQKICHMNSSRL